MLVNPAGIAFDAAGNLWVADYGNQSLAKFSPAQQTAGGNPAPEVLISADAGALSLPVGLAFDAEGNLWVIEGTGMLERYAPGLLTTSGRKAPSASLTLSGHTIFWSVAFWPRPAGLPLN
jgi:sugar lactone lactonase YvrE